MNGENTAKELNPPTPTMVETEGPKSEERTTRVVSVPDHHSTPSTPQDKDEDDENAEERLARSRDRNREHARRTRLRKKAQLKELEKRVKELQDESRMLRQTVEECSIASILLGLSSGQGYGGSDNKEELKEDAFAEIQNSGKEETERTFFTMTGKRKRFVSDAGDGPAPMKLKIKGQTTLVGGSSGKSHINWKTGVYLDENGEQKQLTSEELESLRRERNRMHAKMTRDRKKLFISGVEKTIAALEQNNKRMRDILVKQAVMHSKNIPTITNSVTPEPSSTPMLISSSASTASVPPLSPPSSKSKEEQAKGTICIVPSSNSGFSAVA
jgi:hypothetical protein